MSNNIVPFDFNGFQLRTFGTKDHPFFVAADVCEVLELSDVSMACAGLEEDEKLIQTILVSGQNRGLLCLTESGLWSLVLRSRKPQAKVFKKWLTSEVIPAIRKTGKYEIKQPEPAPLVLPPADVRIANLQNALAFFKIDTNNPRYSQHIQDLILNQILDVGDQKKLPTSEVWIGAVEKAERLGYPSAFVSRFRSTLGKAVKAKNLESKVEKRLCNGTQRDINLYLDCPELDQAIREYLDSKGGGGLTLVA
jgi:hypothetical protein